MIGAIFTGLSGMTAYSRGLDLISNNVANLNTPGFKVSDPLFRELVYNHLNNGPNNQHGTRPTGAGVEVDTSRVSFRQGDLRDTGNDLDVAIDGAGFFVLNRDGTVLYTRAGQFQFDDDGLLVDRDSGAAVMLMSQTSGMGAYNIGADRTYAPHATTQITLTGTLARGGTNTTHQLPPISVVDTRGARMTLQVRLTRDQATPTQWDVDVLNDKNEVIGTGTIGFNDDGTPATDASQVTVSVTPVEGDAFDVVVDFGAPNSHAGVTSGVGSTSSQVSMLRQDGVELGSLTSTTFDERGNLELKYSNGETRQVGCLVVAGFDSPEQLQSIGRSMYVRTNATEPRVSSGMNSGLGRVVGGRVELSNVELTEQFTDLIIIQRGYQASSQIISVANEMMQQLISMESRR